MPAPVHPRHPTHLVGSRWTRSEAEPAGAPFRHFEVSVYRSRVHTVRMRALLSPTLEIEIPWRNLRNRKHWSPGWASVVENEP